MTIREIIGGVHGDITFGSLKANIDTPVKIKTASAKSTGTSAKSTGTNSFGSVFSSTFENLTNVGRNLKIEPPGSTSAFNRSTFNPNAPSLSAKVMTTVESIKNIDLTSVIPASWKEVPNTIGNAADTAKIHLSAYGEIAGHNITGGLQNIMDAGAWVGKTAGELPGHVSNIVTAPYNWVASGNASNFFKQTSSDISELPSKVADALTPPQWASSAASSVVDDFKTAFTQLGRVYDEQVHNKVVAPVSVAISGIYGSAVATVKDYTNKLLSFFENLGTPSALVKIDKPMPRNTTGQLAPQPISLNTLTSKDFDNA